MYSHSLESKCSQGLYLPKYLAYFTEDVDARGMAEDTRKRGVYLRSDGHVNPCRVGTVKVGWYRSIQHH
jgi:hypothetical protein